LGSTRIKLKKGGEEYDVMTVQKIKKYCLLTRFYKKEMPTGELG